MVHAAKSKKRERQGGFALLLSLIALTILAVLVTDLHETTGMSFSAAIAERDQLRAEYLAKSGVNLTRMLIGQEKNIRPLVDGLYQMMFKRRAPQLPVWQYADMLLKPFANFDDSKEDVASAGFSLDLSEGLGETGGTFEIMATSENGKLNVNDPRMEDSVAAHSNISSMLYSLLGGYLPSPNKYDPLFSAFDERGRLTSRLDVLANVIDWWDVDEQRTNFDPVLGAAQSSGAEDTEYYRTQSPPYTIKNAPFDTLEELRLVRGISDDVWATFIEPDLEDPNLRQVTIYGGQFINPNEATPEVLLGRVCAFPDLREQPLCIDPLEQLKFVNAISIGRIAPIPWFSRASDFVGFITGQPEGLYGQLARAAEAMGPTVLFQPMEIKNQDTRNKLFRTFSTEGTMFTIEATGRVGRSQRRIRAVVNTDSKWTPPRPNAGRLPPLGVFAYYRID